MTRPWSMYVVGWMLALALVGCGSDGPNDANSESGSTDRGDRPFPPTTARDGEPLVTCGGIAFKPSAMISGVDGLAEREDLAQALARLVDEAGIDAPLALQGVDIADAEWFLLGGTERTILVATGPWGAEGPGEGAQAVELKKKADGWETSRWGDCNLNLVDPPRLMWAQVRVKKSSLSAQATSVTVLVSEKECTSARDPSHFLQDPVVVETDETVTIYWASTPPEGDQNCPGNPEVERVIGLDGALGQRKLLDGSTWPPTPATRP